MSTMTITLERTPRTVQHADQTLQVEELSLRLPFYRKPADRGDLVGSGQRKVYITETKVLTPAEFDIFARSFLVSHDWLSGKGGSTSDGYLCVEVTAPGRPILYVNPEGTDYARHVARLG